MGAGGIEQARRLLSKTLKPDQAQRILDRVVHSLNTTAGFASLERVNPEQLSKFFLGEHPQTTALILAHLNPTSAAHLLEQLLRPLGVLSLVAIAGGAGIDLRLSPSTVLWSPWSHATVLP